jgi:acetyltransferase-like isoleucine patch superfamily enzyme
MFTKYLYSRFVEFIQNEYRISQLEKRLRNPTIRKPFYIAHQERFVAGENLLIQRYCHFHCGGRAWSSGKGSITIGNNCWFSENNILYGAGDIEIGDFTGTGPYVMIFSSRDNYDIKFSKLPNIIHQFGKVKIGSYVRIFANSVISAGVIVGDGAVIGAGSVVIKDVPPWTIAAGVPAKVIGDRKDDPLIEDKR